MATVAHRLVGIGMHFENERISARSHRGAEEEGNTNGNDIRDNQEGALDSPRTLALR